MIKNNFQTSKVVAVVMVCAVLDFHCKRTGSREKTGT